MTEELTKAIIGALAVILAKDGFWNWFSNRNQKANDRLLMAIARRELIKTAKQYIRQGYIPEDEYDSFIEMGLSYLAKGGNHFGEKKFNEAKELPVIDEDSI